MYLHLKVLYTLPFIISLLLSSIAAFAQEGSDLYLGKLNISDKPSITDIVRLTDTDAYTNQPYFFNGNALYFTQAEAFNDALQTDIFLYHLQKQSITNITQSEQNEYSPTPLPNGDGMSVIRVNSEGKQELWSLNWEGQIQQHLASGIEPVGYQVWINKRALLLFVLGEPHTLQRIDAGSDADSGEIIDSDIGASLFQFQRSPWFVYTKNQKTPVLKAYHADTKGVIELGALPKGSAYFSISSTGHIFTSDGNALFHRQIIAKGERLISEGRWQQVSIDSTSCSSGISRTAISHYGDYIALVCPR